MMVWIATIGNVVASFFLAWFCVPRFTLYQTRVRAAWNKMIGKPHVYDCTIRRVGFKVEICTPKNIPMTDAQIITKVQMVDLTLVSPIYSFEVKRTLRNG